MTITKISQLADPDLVPCVVLKIGSALLVGEDGEPRREWLALLADEIAQARRIGQNVVVVCSGSIALGAAKLDLPDGGRGSLVDAQASASVGQIALASLWTEYLGNHGLTAAQILLTLVDFEDRRRYLNASATIEGLLKAGAVPVINENDSVATHEIRFGDNDRLAARVAQAAQAQAVVLLSDIDGLYDRDPSDPDANLIEHVDGVDETIHAMATGGSGSGMGSGGMTSKLQAAEIAERAGITLAIVNGTHDSPLLRAIGNNCGTIFVPQRHDSARKAWLGGRQRLDGAVSVDAGCAAVLAKGENLLASGITSVEGSFKRGDPIAIKDGDGETIARGLSEYNSGEAARIAGCPNDEHAKILGYAPRTAAVHRDQLVLL